MGPSCSNSHYSTHIFTAKAEQFIVEHAEEHRHRPLFLYLAYQVTPLRHNHDRDQNSGLTEAYLRFAMALILMTMRSRYECHRHHIRRLIVGDDDGRLLCRQCTAPRKHLRSTSIPSTPPSLTHIVAPWRVVRRPLRSFCRPFGLIFTYVTSVTVKKY
jgi:hypothetical protein